ncbi:hypothetical protein SteCoe_37003 [Stentor coeruleus]|uniref:PIPK domain-containing protein n=1 Tax=Stentor coeruleus TaxID=5963 RepID=A0A1R2ANX7_9CILI|nr:hypothetical protein SteCoe_37003 [Stentor coeruleus]
MSHNPLEVICIILSFCSLIVTIFCALVHIIVPKLRRNPGQLVLYNCIIQLVADVNWFWVSIDKNSYFNSLKPKCHILGGIVSACLLLQILYTLYLCIEILILVHKKIATPHTNRIRMYHLTTLIILSIVLGTEISRKEFGDNNQIFCFFEQLSLSEKMFFLVSGVSIIIIWVLSTIILKKLNKKVSNLTKRYLKVTILLTFLITLSALMGVIVMASPNSNIFKQLALFLACPTGLVVGLGRLWSKSLMRELKWKICKRRINLRNTYVISESLLEGSVIKFQEEPMCLAEYFESNNLKTLMKILTSLSLRFSSSQTNYEAYKKYKEYYFEEEDFFREISKINASNLEELYDPNLTVTEYNADIFVKIRESKSIFDSDLQGVFLNNENFVKMRKKRFLDGGKSGSLLFCTYNKKYIIKIITEDEAHVFLDILKIYSNRILNCPESKLVRIYGLFQIKPYKLYILLMENLFENSEKMTIFDLKGSRVNRKTLRGSGKNQSANTSVQKDEDFLNSGIQIAFDSEAEKIIQVLGEDFLLLRGMEMTDYSLIIGIDLSKLDNESARVSDGIVFGIIDFLQKYNIAKKSEKHFKSLFYKTNEISAADPEFYYRRIKEFLNKIFTR